MSGPQTIEPSGRFTPCAPGCLHPLCARLRREANDRAYVARGIEIETLISQIRVAIFSEIAHHDTTIDRALAALDRLTTLAKEPR